MSPESSALILRLRESLTQQRYNAMVVHNYCRNADHFLAYLIDRKINITAVTPMIVSEYLGLAVREFRKRRGRAPAQYWVSIPRSGIHALLRLTLKRWPPEPIALNDGELLCREVCDQYQKWLREERGLAVASIDALMWEAKHFCAWHMKRSAVASFADLSIQDALQGGHPDYDGNR
jgi:integrase/recombinase XerD